MIDIEDAVHLHRADYPATLRLLTELVGRRTDLDGYEVTDTGAWVDWARLAEAKLSSTQIAVVHIAHGCAILERHGGAGPLAGVTFDVVGSVA